MMIEYKMEYINYVMNEISKFLINPRDVDNRRKDLLSILSNEDNDLFLFVVNKMSDRYDILSFKEYIKPLVRKDLINNLLNN